MVFVLAYAATSASVASSGTFVDTMISCPSTNIRLKIQDSFNLGNRNAFLSESSLHCANTANIALSSYDSQSHFPLSSSLIVLASEVWRSCL